MRRELLWLVLAAALVHALFLAGSYLFELEHTSDTTRLAYTAVWTAVTLAVVLRALARIRAHRGRAHRGRAAADANAERASPNGSV